MKVNLSVIGLGKLGACIAACFASKGFNVIGVDTNPNTIKAIQNKKAPIEETDLEKLIELSGTRFQVSLDYKYAVENSDISFIILPTPTLDSGHFSNDYLEKALTQLALVLKKLNKFHTFVISSTVSPQSTEKILIPLIESISEKKVNIDFGVVYNPEFIALGSVIKDFFNPDIVLIGESNPFVGKQLEKIYLEICENNPYIARMSIISAEIAKISLNSYITMKISFANTLANICEKIPGTDVDQITQAIGMDKRIAPYYLKGGMPFGGPCFPRDNQAFAAFTKTFDVQAKQAILTDSINQEQLYHLLKIVCQQIKKHENTTVCIIGLSYKPNTPVIEESAAINLIKMLLDKNLAVVAFDPLAMNNVKTLFGETIDYSDSLEDCFSKASIFIITTPDPLFQCIDDTYIGNNNCTIIDCWRILDPIKIPDKCKYIALGKYQMDH